MVQPGKLQAATRTLWNAEQTRLAGLRAASDEVDWSVGESGEIRGLSRIAGVDLSFFPDSRHAVAAVVVLSFPELEVLEERFATLELTVPYVAGYLAFREVPALVGMLRALEPAVAPQAVLVDGNGAFHPRRCGAATHLGIVTGFPTVGVAKDVLLVGSLGARKAEEIAKTLLRPGEWAPFAEEGQDPLAAILRPGRGTRTLVVSPGHRVCLRTAALLVRAVCPNGVPEPIRQADLRSRRAVAAWLGGTPLPALATPTPAGKRRRRGARADQDESNGAVLLKLIEAYPDAKKAGPAAKAELVWRPKVSAQVAAAPAGEACGEGPAIAASPQPLGGGGGGAARAPEAGDGPALPWEPFVERPPPRRECCLLGAIPAFLGWLLCG